MQLEVGSVMEFLTADNTVVFEFGRAGNVRSFLGGF